MGNGREDTAPIPLWVEKKFDRLEKDKADRPVVKANTQRLESKIESLEAQLDDPPCKHTGDISAMQVSISANTELVKENSKELRKAYRLYARGLVALIFILLTTGAGAVWYLAGLAFEIQDHGVAIKEIKTKVLQVETNYVSAPHTSSVMIEPASVDVLAPLKMEQVIENAASLAAKKAVKETLHLINSIKND